MTYTRTGDNLTGDDPTGNHPPGNGAPEILRLALLGGFRLWRGDAECGAERWSEVRLASQPARKLLALLALQSGQPVERGWVLAQLWPDGSEQARRALSQALWRARQALPELSGALEADSQRLRLRLNPADPPALSVDVEQLRRLLDAPGLDHHLLNDHRLDDSRLDDRSLEDLESGLALCRFELLPGWDDDWLQADRRAVQEWRLRALETLTRAHEGRLRGAQALELAGRWAEADPLSEAAHRAVMRLAASLGRPAEAQAAYARLSAALRTELGIRPAPETQALHGRLERHQAEDQAESVTVPTLRQAPLIGRDAERRQLLSALDGGRSGGAALLLEGEAGLGKTRLLRELATDAQWRGSEVLWGQGSESAASGFAASGFAASGFAGSGPFGALCQALGSVLTPARATELAARLEPVWLAAVAPLLPALYASDQRQAQANPNRRAQSTAERAITERATEWLQIEEVRIEEVRIEEVREEALRVRAGLRRVLEALAAAGPCLLILDDAHWLDEGSLEVLSSLSAAPLPNLTLLLAYRPGDARDHPALWALLGQLDLLPGTQRLILAPLSLATACDLARASLDLGGGLSALDLSVPELSTLATRLARESGGHPLYLLETLRALLDAGTLRREAGQWRSPAAAGAALPLSTGLRSAVVGRLARLARAPRALLDVAALLAEGGAPLLSPALLLAAAGLGPAQAASLDLLVRRGWLERQGDYAESAGGACAAGGIYAAGGAYTAPHDLVRRAVVSELTSDQRAAHHARIAAALERLQPDQPALIARHALAAGCWPLAAQAQFQAARQARALHDYPAVRALLDTLLGLVSSPELPDPELSSTAPLRAQLSPKALTEALELHWQASRVAGDLEAQRRDLEALAALAAPGSSAALQLGARRAELLGLQGEVEAALSLAAQVRAQGLAAGFSLVVAQAQTSLRAICSAHGHYEEAVAHGAQAVALWRALGDGLACARALFTLGGDEMSLARSEAAAEHLQEALDLFEMHGDRLGVADALGSLAVVEDSRNQRARSRAYQLRALETHRASGSLIGTGRSLHNLAWMDTDRHHLASGLRLYRQALELFVSVGDTTREMHTRRSLTGLLVIQLGHWEAAHSQLEITDAHYQRTGNTRGQWYNLDARMYLAVQQGEYGAALALTEQMHRLALQAGDRPCEVMARWSAARLRTVRGDAASLEAFAALRADIEALEMPGMTGEYDGQLGAALLRAGQAAGALPLIEASLHASQGQETGGEHEPRLMPELHHLRSLALSALGRSAEADAALDRAYCELCTALDGLDQPELTLTRVPEWRELVRDWEARRLRRTRLDLLDRRGGRASVQLTLEAPEDLTRRSRAERRQTRLARLLREADQQGAAPRVADLARLLECGTATIKRDLAVLRRRPGP